MVMDNKLLRPITSGVLAPDVDGGGPATVPDITIDGGEPSFTGPLLLDGGTP